jgi:hypothetical protein
VQAVVKIDKGFRRPDLRLKFLAGHQFARAIQQGHQYLYRLTLQPQPDTRLAQLASPNIKLKTIEPQDARDWSRCQHSDSP